MKKKNSFIMKNENFFLEQKHFDGLLPILWTGLGCWACRRWRARSAQAGVRGRAGEGAGVGAGRSARGAQAAAASARGAQAGTRAGVGATGRGERHGRARGQLGGRRARGRAAGVGARGAGRGRAAWAWPGRLGWPWAVHSVHSAHFRSVLTRFFS